MGEYIATSLIIRQHALAMHMPCVPDGGHAWTYRRVGLASDIQQLAFEYAEGMLAGRMRMRTAGELFGEQQIGWK